MTHSASITEPRATVSPGVSHQSLQRRVDLDYLRGFAILLIVLGHSTFYSITNLPAIYSNLVNGWTFLFVFISGFFLHRVYYLKRSYAKMMHKKIQTVLLPSLVVSFVALASYSAAKLALGATLSEVWEQWARCLRRGYVMAPLWYIPFIMIVYAMTPAYFLFLRLSLRTQLFLVSVWMVLAMLVHRPVGLANVAQSLFYFSPVYLLGMLYSQHESLFVRYKRPVIWIAGLLSLFFLVYASMVGEFGPYFKEPFVYGGIDWMYPQKVFAVFVLLGFCGWLATVTGRISVLVLLAESSFAIYFLHTPFSIKIIYNLALSNVLPEGLRQSPLFWIVLSVLVCVFAIAVFIALAAIVRKVAKSHSRMLIGW